MTVTARESMGPGTTIEKAYTWGLPSGSTGHPQMRKNPVDHSGCNIGTVSVMIAKQLLMPLIRPPQNLSSVVWDYMLALNRLGESHELTLVWVPGHQSIPGNEIADRLANLGTLMDPEAPVISVPFAQEKLSSKAG